MRQNRLQHVDVPTKKEAAKQMKRGTLKTLYDDNNCLTVWKDSQAVYVGSNFCGPDPVGKCTRYAGPGNGYKEFPCPKSILNYNSTMGGIDLINQMMKCYRISIRNRKWYWGIYTWFLNVLMVQAWRLYQSTMRARHVLLLEEQLRKDEELEQHLETSSLQRTQKDVWRREHEERNLQARKAWKKLEEKPLLEFIRECVEVMLHKHSNINQAIKVREPAGRLSNATAEFVRYDLTISHLVVDTSIKGVCQKCKKRSNYRCETCNVALHPGCFKGYHTK